MTPKHFSTWAVPLGMPRGSSFTSLVGLAAPLALSLACMSDPFSAGVQQPQGAAGEDSTPAGGSTSGASGGDGGVRPTPIAGASSGGSADIAEAGAASVPGGQGGSTVLVTARCPQLPGEKLVLVDGFCIDESEVTAASYRAFVDSAPSTTDQPYECLGNTTFANNCQYTDPERQPVRCIDWCDARAYCSAVGKQLCGAAATAGAPMPFDAASDALDDQWYSACSQAGRHAYPYGDDYDDSACWSAERPPIGVMLVKSAPGCVGGYDGLWDMSGGLAEWVDSCSDDKGMGDACRIRGGSHGGTADQLRCDWQSGTARDTSSHYIGFRCCADAE